MSLAVDTLMERDHIGTWPLWNPICSRSVSGETGVPPRWLHPMFSHSRESVFLNFTWELAFSCRPELAVVQHMLGDEC